MWNVSARLDEHGHEIPDPTPVAIPAGFKKPETLAEQVQRLVRTHLSRAAAEQGYETFEEAEDFDTGEDDDLSSPYETFFDPVLGKDLSAAEFRANEQEYRRRYLLAQREYFQSLDRHELVTRGPQRARRAPSERESSESPKPAAREVRKEV